MPVIIEYRKQKIEFQAPISIREILQHLNLPQESFHILCNGLMVDDDTILQDDDEVKLIPVISGG